MTFISALLLGLIASPHCAGMCGGLQMALQGGAEQATVRSPSQQHVHLLLLNFGRITTYIVAGIVFTCLGAELFSQLNIQDLSRVLRIMAGTVILLIGIQLLWRAHRPFQFLEGMGAILWQSMSKLIKHDGGRVHQSYLSGIAWGFLPCGLVYGVVLTAVFADNIGDSALIMLGFGLGTLPAMLLTGTAYQWLRAWNNSSSVQVAGGLFFLLGGVLMLSAPYWVSTQFLQDYPVLLNAVFCLT